MVLLASLAPAAHAVLLTFDGYTGPHWDNPTSYGWDYGIGFDSFFIVADHSGSTWGPPHSLNNVLIVNPSGHLSEAHMWFGNVHTGIPSNIYTFGGYFSTEPGTVLEILGHGIDGGNPVSAYIGAAGESWNNRYVQIGSSVGIDGVEFRALTADALQHFCADDVNVEFVPEPSSVLAILAGLSGIGGLVWRRRLA